MDAPRAAEGAWRILGIILVLRLLTPLLLLLLLLTACGPVATPTPVATQPPVSTITPKAATPTPQPTHSPTATPVNLQYSVLYQQPDGFSIRQAYLGPNVIWRWDDFPTPPTRIQNTLKSLGLGRQMICENNSASSTPCEQTIRLAENEYTLRLADVKGGSALLTKNNKLLWTGVTNGANNFAILSSKQLGDALVLEYAKSNWGNTDERLWVTTSILITQEKNVRLIPEAFAPNIINDQLIYFRVKTGKDILVFDGKDVGDSYNYIFNLTWCCWHGPSLEIANDGKIVDFFAQKDDGWYHVQAGYLPKP